MCMKANEDTITWMNKEVGWGRIPSPNSQFTRQCSPCSLPQSEAMLGSVGLFLGPEECLAMRPPGTSHVSTYLHTVASLLSRSQRISISVWLGHSLQTLYHNWNHSWSCNWRSQTDDCSSCAVVCGQYQGHCILELNRDRETDYAISSAASTNRKRCSANKSDYNSTTLTKELERPNRRPTKFN